jgi:CRISPR/Cas system CMR subunit Cmr6 (Cas7 group RAMP superfamily)
LVAGDRGESLALFERVARLLPEPVWEEGWRRFLALDLNLPADQVVFGRLQSRLMTNLWAAGDEPANPLLSRFSGQPFIPGSAIKACAQRMAAEQLRNLADRVQQEEWGVGMALAFGWSTSSPAAWSPGIRNLVWRRLEPGREFSEAEWQRRYARRAGAVWFLPAYTWSSLQPDLEWDVVVSQHRQYYAGHSGFEGAPDVEPPRVRYHAAVAPGAVFAFPVPGTTPLHETARDWLRQGLALMGLGARQSAGYGWFDASSQVQSEMGRQYETCQREWQRMAKQQQEQERLREQQEASQRTAAALSEKLSAMDEDERREYDWLQLKEVQFWGKLQRFRSLSLEDQGACIRVLQQARASLWDELKQRARKGGQWAQLEHAIRACARENELGRMP